MSEHLQFGFIIRHKYSAVLQCGNIVEKRTGMNRMNGNFIITRGMLFRFYIFTGGMKLYKKRYNYAVTSTF